MNIEIKRRHTGEVLWSSEAESMRDAVAKAIAAGANLAGAYLADANLADADLAGANLAGAYLADADLAGANLAGAYLAGAYLAGANLADADLAGANLAGADLADANLAGAYLAGADLAGADLADANLAGAYLAGANLAGAYLAGANLAGAYLAGARNFDRSKHVEPTDPYVIKPGRSRLEHAQLYRERHPEIPVVENLDSKILGAIEAGGTLDMGSWHLCETTHCRAGWAIHLAGKAGYDLEKKLGGAEYAGRAIYRASTGRAPHFYATTERALEDIKRCATEDTNANRVGSKP